MKKKKFFILVAVIFTALVFFSTSASVDAEKMQEINALDLSIKPQDINSRGAVKPDLNFGKFPLYFIFNKGQVNKKAKFYAKASRYTLWLTKEGLVFDSFKKVKDKVEVEEGKERHTPPFGHPSQEGNNQLPHSPYSPYSTHSPKLERDVSRLVFLDANKNPEIVPLEEAQLRVNYFIGNDKSKWHCDVPTSEAVLYKNLYKDIDLKVYGIEKQIEYDWIVKPGGNPQDIRFEYKNVRGTRLDDEGYLLIETNFGELIHKKPVSYQERKAPGAKRTAQIACPKGRIDVNVSFKKISNNTYGFEVGEYDKDCELIIDPVILAYSTYLGGDYTEYGNGIAVDSQGYAYVAGWTHSEDFPTLNQYQTYQGDYDVFVTKIDTTQGGASSLIYSTFLGGGDTDFGYGIAVDNSGYAYVTGNTFSTDFPTLNQYQTFLKGYDDVFVTKLDTTQSGVSSLIYSTYLGGHASDEGRGIAVDSSGNAYVTGNTFSADFPILNQYQNYRYYDAFVTRIDTTKSGSSTLIYSTLLGGGDGEVGNGIAVDSSGYAYVTGWTTSEDFPILNQYQAFPGGYYNAFVTKIDTTQGGASSLIYSTYLGGNNSDGGRGIAVDGSGNAYVTGETLSTDFPNLNQYQTDQTGWDAFVTKLDTTQSGARSLIYSTYLGGGSVDWSYGIAVDKSGSAYVTGYTSSPDFPTLDQYQTHQGAADAFVTKIDTTQSGISSLIYSTYLGGNKSDTGRGIAVDSSGNAYVTGETWSTDFPTLNQYKTYPKSWYDAFVTKLSFIPPNSPPVAVCKDIEISADENCQADIIAEYVDDGSYDPDDDPITLSIDNSGPLSLGEHAVNLTVTDEHGESDTCQAKVTVVDTTPPIIESFSVSPNVLWPANHKMVAVTLGVTVSDNCDTAPKSKIVSVTSNEPVNGTGDGDTAPDWEITGDLTVNLRAERSGKGSGRVYTVTVLCTDAYGNSSTGTINITVPHDKR
jgi:hypothetical protein